MAQLPPKFPDNMSIPQAWHHHNLPRPPPASSFFPPSLSYAAAAIHPSWADEFYDFSSAKRGAHRRTMSDSIAFLESTVPGPSPAGTPPASSEFDRLDDAQLISMFSDHVPPSSSTAPSTPSDNNSINDHGTSDTHDASEAQSASNAELTAAAEASPVTLTAPIGDPRRVKRILANRQSAQRSRVRKLHYISELERSVTSLQTEVSALSPRVAFFDHQRSILTVGNSHLKQRIAALAQDQIFKDAHEEALRKEIERLRNVYHQQNLKKLAVAADIKELPANT